jgi:hypothetical protein
MFHCIEMFAYIMIIECFDFKDVFVANYMRKLTNQTTAVSVCSVLIPQDFLGSFLIGQVPSISN